MTDSQKMARAHWVVGIENAKLTFKTGEVREFVTFTTNIYEEDGNRWLMVSHQAAMRPKQVQAFTELAPGRTDQPRSSRGCEIFNHVIVPVGSKVDSEVATG